MRRTVGLLCAAFLASSASLWPYPSIARSLTVRDASALPGEKYVTVGIAVDNALGIAGAKLVLAYDPAVLTAKGVQAAALTEGLSLAAETGVAGQITAAFAGADGLSGSGDLLMVFFDVNVSAIPGAYPLTLTRAELQGVRQPLPVSRVNPGLLTVLIPPPTADFSVVPISGPVPLMVRFTDLSTNAPTSWSWEFGDGNTSGQQNPVHTYIDSGRYTVTLIASNAGGNDEKVRAEYIEATDAPSIAQPGTIHTVAGNGTRTGPLGSGRFTGDGEAATAASLNGPTGLFMDGSGHLYIADAHNHRIRRVDATTGAITTVAGNGVDGYSGDGGTATDAGLSYPADVFVDGGGHLLIADANNNRVRRVDATTGAITTVAGDGTSGFSGEGGQAILARLSQPTGIFVDHDGDLYIADRLNHRVRKVDGATGTITTLVGSSTEGAGAGAFGGDGGPAILASLNEPVAVFVDGAGDLVIADRLNHRIRKVDGATGVISTVVGSGETGLGAGGFSGEGSQATDARLAGPEDIFVDAVGNQYICDGLNRRVRRVDASGRITTVAGYGDAGHTGDGGPATLASLAAPSSVLVNAVGDVCVGDRLDHRVRHISAIGASTVLQPGVFAPEAQPVLAPAISTLAGAETEGFGGDGGPASLASLNSPAAVFADGAGTLHIADADNHRIRRVDAAGAITTIAGDGFTTEPFGLGRFGGEGAAATSASLAFPTACVVDSAGNIYIADTYNHRIRKIDAQTGDISTVVGDGFADDSRDGRFSGDWGFATRASLNYPMLGLFLDRVGNLYLSDTRNHRVRRVDAATGIIATIAGDGFTSEDGEGRFSGDGESATRASLHYPNGIFVDEKGDLYIADSSNHRIRKVDGETGIITTAAGDGFADDEGVGRFHGDGGPATLASLNDPNGLFVDGSGDVFIADQDNHRVRVVDAETGIISTVAGTGREGGFGSGRFGGDGGAATNATLWLPTSVSVDVSGTLYICDMGNHRIRTVEGLAAPTYLVLGVYAPPEDITITRTPDFTGDGRVDFADFVLFAQSFGKREGDPGFDARLDLDDSGSVGFGDFVLFAQSFGRPV